MVSVWKARTSAYFWDWTLLNRYSRRRSKCSETASWKVVLHPLQRESVALLTCYYT